MTAYSPDQRPVPPSHIIDLRPQAARVKTAWFDLLAVRFLRYLWRLLIDFFIAIGSMIHNLFTFKPKPAIERTVREVKREIKKETKILSAAPVKKHSHYFRIINFVAILCLIISPLLAYKAWTMLAPWRQEITSNTQAAFAGLFAGKDFLEQENFSGAEQAFTRASEDFVSAQASLQAINRGLLEIAGVLPNDSLRLASESRHLLNAGKLSARIGAGLSAAISPTENSNLIQKIERFAAHAIPAAEDGEQLVKELNKVDPEHLPETYREQFLKLKEQASVLVPGLRESVELSKRASVFLGKHYDKRYLLVFQNNSERRASGGFLGSFAVIDIKQGEITNLNVPKGGSYDTEAGLYRRVVAPAPLWLVNPLWHFWDANWWPDWPTTARKLQWFYEKSDGPTVDGVISLTPTVIERLLAVQGPIDMTNDYGVIINSENFWEVTQSFSEQKPDVTKEPKKIIGDLMTKLMEEIPKNMNQEKLLGLIGVFEESLDEKHILMYFNDPTLEKSAEFFGWDGRVKQSPGDYLMVVSSNIGGQKSDRYINEHIEHDAEILPDGRIVVNLTVRREHTAPKNQQFVGFRNVNWLRVYVPEGSRLISASGFKSPEQSYFSSPDPSWELDLDLEAERNARTDPATGTKIYSETGKTVFANWSMVDPGETAVIKFQYELPFKLQATEANGILNKFFPSLGSESRYRYSLLAQKQPGAERTTLSSRLHIDAGWKPLWNYPSDITIDDKGWIFGRPLNQDSFTQVLFHKP